MALMNSIWAQKERACLLVRSAVCLVVHFHRERACVEAVASLLRAGCATVRVALLRRLCHLVACAGGLREWDTDGRQPYPTTVKRPTSTHELTRPPACSGLRALVHASIAIGFYYAWLHADAKPGSKIVRCTVCYGWRLPRQRRLSLFKRRV
jgi:hypothetical protein